MSELSQWVELEQAADFSSGGTPSKTNSAYWDGGIPWVSAKDMKSPRLQDTEDHISEIGLANGSRLASAGSTLVLVRGMTLLNDVPMCLASRDMAFNQDIKALTPKHGVVGAYLNYALRAAKPQLLAAVDLAGHGTGKLPTDVLKAIRIWLPAAKEQERIAQILGSFDEKIELNRRINDTLESMARAIFQSWFVDFDPVQAKIGGESPDSICERLGLTSELLALFPQAFDESSVGVFPAGWSISSIGALADIVGGSTPNTKESIYWDEGQYAWATPKDLSRLSTSVLLDTERRVTDAGLAQIGSGLLPPGTVLMSSRAPIGYRAINELPVAINQGFIAMKPNHGVSRYFLLYWAEWALQEIVSRANGSTFLEISKSNFRPIPVMRPPNALFAAFDQVVQPLYRRLVANEKEIQLLTEQRDVLLPELLAGRTIALVGETS